VNTLAPLDAKMAKERVLGWQRKLLLPLRLVCNMKPSLQASLKRAI
jgi:hypothetical protein